MLEVMRSPQGQLVMGLAVLSILIALGTFVVLKFRGEADDADEIENASSLLTKFREMKHEGHLNDEEYRTIRTDLEGKLSKHSSADAVDPDRTDRQG